MIYAEFDDDAGEWMAYETTLFGSGVWAETREAALSSVDSRVAEIVDYASRQGLVRCDRCGGCGWAEHLSEGGLRWVTGCKYCEKGWRRP